MNTSLVQTVVDTSRQSGKTNRLVKAASATQKKNFNALIESVHESITYSCDKCEYEGQLIIHKESINKNVTYTHDQCENKARQKEYLKNTLNLFMEMLFLPVINVDIKQNVNHSLNFKGHIKYIHH